MMILWAALAAVLCAAGAIGFVFAIRGKRAAAGSKGDSDVTMVDRITEKFPNVRRTQPENRKAESRRGKDERGERTERRTGVGLQGNLAQTPLHDLLQYLALGSKSGILELTCGRRTGRMVLKDGRVTKNSYRGKEGLEAVFMMMDLAEGDFEFYEQVLEEPAHSEDLEVVDIIMLWMDRKPKKKQTSG
jgi:hypothetical protein